MPSDYGLNQRAKSEIEQILAGRGDNGLDVPEFLRRCPNQPSYGNSNSSSEPRQPGSHQLEYQSNPKQSNPEPSLMERQIEDILNGSDNPLDIPLFLRNRNKK